MIFIDSSYLIAIALKTDQWNKKALKIAKKLENKNLILSKLILSETITLIGKIAGGKSAKIFYNYIKQNYRIYDDKLSLYDEAIEIHLMYDGTLSFADAVSVEIMKKLNINKIVSFDSDFDKVNEIQRIF